MHQTSAIYLRFLGAYASLLALGTLSASALVVAGEPIPRSVQTPLIGNATLRAVELGSVRSEDIVTHDFRLLNDTGEKVVVRKVRASCGCSLATLEPTTVDAGSDAVLSVKISTGPFPGIKSVSLAVDASVGGKPAEFDFSVSMQVLPMVTFSDDKPVIDLGQVDVSRAAMPVEIVASRGPNPTEWDRIHGESSDPRVHLEIVSSKTHQWRLLVTAVPDDQLGRLAADIKLHFYNGDREIGYSLSRHVLATIIGPIRAAPSSWLIGQVAPLERPQQLIEISPTMTNLIVEKITPLRQVGSVSVALNPSEKNRLRLVYTPRHTAGPDTGEVLMRVTTNKGAFTIRIPYIALVLDERSAVTPSPTLAPQSMEATQKHE